MAVLALVATALLVPAPGQSAQAAPLATVAAPPPPPDPHVDANRVIKPINNDRKPPSGSAAATVVTEMSRMHDRGYRFVPVSAAQCSLSGQYYVCRSQLRRDGAVKGTAHLTVAGSPGRVIAVRSRLT
jgi:hypothetical protein